MSVNRKLNEVLISQNGFSKSEITISEGENLSFTLNTRKNQNEEPQDHLLEQSLSIIQVILDDVDGKYRPVIGGYKFDKIENRVIVKFRIQGEFTFMIVNQSTNLAPCKVKVVKEIPISLLITDEGFLPRIVRIDEGTTLKWTWQKLSYPHSINEAEYCDNHGGIFQSTKELVMPSLTNSYKRKFDEPGVFYFQTESRNTEQKHVCIVEVQQLFKEHSIEIFDNKFSPSQITIFEGDKVWFYWNKDKCLKRHCIYQIHPPAPDHPLDKAYIPVKNGFKWTNPTRVGMMCHTFDKCGVYYFGDLCGDECASYIGIIAVKQKQEHHVINYVEETKRFEQEILTVETGDLIWWRWTKTNLISMNLIDASLLYDKQIDKNKCKNYNGCHLLDSNGLAKAGIYSYKIKKAGCYYFRVFNGNEESVITVIATSVPKDHKIDIYDTEAKPSILNIHPEDRVWFIWNDSKKAQNIRQVNHANKIIKNGFLSGSLIDAPGAFVEAFNNLGIFYYRSDNFNGILGAIVVVPEPTIHVVHVNERGLDPDPIVIHLNDLVLWEFEKFQSNDLVLIKDEKDLFKYADLAEEILPRRYLSRSFKEPGVYHFVSPSFDTSVNISNKSDIRGLDNTVLSTIIVDKFEEYTTVLLDLEGFYPDLVNVEIGKSVLFDWRESNQSHNIVHVNLPNEKYSLTAVEGPKAFNSGKPVMNNSFLYTFEEEGVFCVASESSPKTYCLIKVLQSPIKTETPKLVNQDPFVLYKYHKIFLDCVTPDAVIHYTTDGSTPNKLSPLYNIENGVIMSDEGINIIRAVAFSEKYLTSDIFTSSRFYVIADPDQNNEYARTRANQFSSSTNEVWWKCIPRIVTNSVGVGCIEISWDKAYEKLLDLISHYQIFLNKVSYRKVIPSNINKVLVKGLCGGRNYDITVMVYPKDKSLLPQQSNILTIKCPKTTNLGGPIISIKANSSRDKITVCWSTNETSLSLIDHYELLINGEKREKIIPVIGMHKITIEKCKIETKYSIIVVAIPKDNGVPLISNELEITLPLNLDEISLPDPALRKLDKDYYDEYIEITDLDERRYIGSENVISQIKNTNETEPVFAPHLAYENYLIIEKNNQNNDLVPKQVLEKTKSNKDLRNLDNKTNTLGSNKEINNNIILLNNEITEVNEDLLPTPKVSVTHVKSGTISVEWYMSNLPPRHLILAYYVITLVGNEFSNTIISDASYECLIEKDGKQIPAVQHCWISKNNANAENKFLIDGVLDTAIYQITVNAVYKLADSSDTTEYKKSSKTIYYTPLGPPNPVRLRINAVDLQSATLEWIPPFYPRPEFIAGYRLIVNSDLNQAFEKNINEFLFSEMQPGRKYKIEIITLSNSIVGESKPSNSITLICPRRPQPPLISQLPSVRPNSAVIGWKPCDPRSNESCDQILFYQIYVNEKYHGEIHSSNLNSYSYMICDLIPGQTYEVMVKSFSGERFTHPFEGPYASCLISSEPSNNLSVSATAPPDAVKLRVASISPDGIDLTWPFPQQYGDAVVSGFQLVKNGRCYGNIISYDMNSFKLNDLELGETVNLQIISLTNHPVGKYTALHNHPDYTMDQPQREMLVNGIQSNPNVIKNSPIHPDYPACKIGPVLSVKFTNIVKPAVKIWTEKVTGYSAVVIFQTSKMNEHFIDPEYFLVSYWPGNNPSDNLKTIKTDKDFVQLNNLKPTTIYTVQVESRRESLRIEEISDEKENEYKYIVYSKSNLMQFQTASPPDPPTNLSVVSTTCHAMKIVWDPPVDHGSELIAIRIDCFPLNTEKPLHIFKELTPDIKSCIIDNLTEKTNYRVIVTAITEEYFVNHKIKEIKQLPKLILESMPWLPSAHIDAMTSGTDPPYNLEWKLKHDKSIGVNWNLAKCYGTNRLINQILCYQDLLNLSNNMAIQVPLPSNTRGYKLYNLRVGSKYRVWVEAVVLLKINIDSDIKINDMIINSDNLPDQNLNKDYYKQLKDTRCTNVCSEPLFLRIPAPCEPVIVNLTGYSNEHIDLYWSKPNLYSQHKDPDNKDHKYHLYRHLIGYRIEVNGIRQRSLSSNENFCSLTKCKPSNTYSIVVVALTCLSHITENSNQLIENEIDITDIDESYSIPLQVKTFSNEKDDQLTSLVGKYEEVIDTNEPKSVGRIRLDWDVKNNSKITQFNVNWFSAEEGLTKRKTFDQSTRSCFIPVTKFKCIYEINLEVVYEEPSLVYNTDRIFIETPGSPDAPELWLREHKDNNVTINWSEPKTYPFVPLGGYQLFLNDIKVGAKIDKDVLKATLPLKPNRNYKINIQALSSRSEFPDSVLSNSLNVTTSIRNTSQNIITNSSMRTLALEATGFEATGESTQVESLRKFYEEENQKELDIVDTLIPLRIKNLNEDSADLDWSQYKKTDEALNEFKIEWHCLNTNEHFEYRCTKNLSTYKIKRLKSGYTYCVRIFAIRNLNTIITRSKNIILQMAASPDPPVIKLRACNFKYITIEWNKPLTYGELPIVAYKLFINGKAEAVLSAEQTVFTLTKGDPCREYVFEVQAMTSDESQSSPISKPLKVVWPGVKLPTLRAIESENEVLRITWDEPILSGNAKISFFRVIAECEHSGKVSIQGPFESSIRECEFYGLNSGRHKIHLEITAYGSAEPICTHPIYVDFGHKPEAPNLDAQILGLDERRKLEKILGNLNNKRDILLRTVTNKNNSEKSFLPKAISNLRQIDDTLNDCLKLIGYYTGFFIVNLTWSNYQPDQAVKLLGFRVYINDRQYGMDLSSTVTNIRIKLSLECPEYSIYITAFTDRAKMESQNSNVVQILSEKFFPFSFYCINNIHIRNTTWPDKGCCAYQDSLSHERNLIGKTKEPINLGYLNDKIQALKCEVLDLESNRNINLIDGKTKSGKPTVILFWTKWCFSSIKFLRYFTMYAKRNNQKSEFIACHYGKEDRNELLDLLRKAGYLDNSIKFVNDITYLDKTENYEVSSVKEFDIKGVPTIVIVNKNGLIVWKGRYCAFDFTYFECFLHHQLSEALGIKCPVLNCEFCSGDVSIDRELDELRSEQKYLKTYLDSVIKPTTDTWTGVEITKRSVPRLPKISTKQLISVRTNAPSSANRNRSGSERALIHTNSAQVINSYTISKKKLRSNSIDGFCFYRSNSIKKVK